MKFLIALVFTLYAIICINSAAAELDASVCDQRGQGYWEEPSDCTKFHICYKLPGALHYVHHSMKCFAGEAWNSQYGFCSKEAVKTFC